MIWVGMQFDVMTGQGALNEGMDDSEIEGWYKMAEANDWDGIPICLFEKG